MGGVADHAGQDGDTFGAVVEGEVVEQRTQQPGVGTPVDDDLVGGRSEHGATVARTDVTAPHLIAHLTRVRSER